MELLKLGLQGLLSLSGWQDNLLDESVLRLHSSYSNQSVLWLEFHLVFLGIVEKAET